MRHAHRSLVVVTFAAGAVLAVACTTSPVDTNNGVQTQGTGGSGAGATGGTSGTGAGGSAGTTSLGGAAGTSSLGGAAGTSSLGGAAGTTSAGGAGGTSGGALLRFAHLVPDAPAFDLCFRECAPGSACKTGSFTDAGVIGPIFSKGGDLDKFYFPGISLRLEIGEGTWETRVVAHDAKDCSTPLGIIGDQQKSYVTGHSYTLAFVGEVAQGVAITLSDEPSFPLDGKVGYRVFNGLTASPKVDFGVLETGSNFVPLAAGAGIVAFTPSVMVPDDPSTSQPAFIANGTTTLLATGIGFTSKANEEWSIFAAGTKVADPEPAKRPQVVRCDENDTTPEAGTTNIQKCTYGSM